MCGYHGAAFLFPADIGLLQPRVFWQEKMIQVFDRMFGGTPGPEYAVGKFLLSVLRQVATLGWP